MAHLGPMQERLLIATLLLSFAAAPAVAGDEPQTPAATVAETAQPGAPGDTTAQPQDALDTAQASDKAATTPAEIQDGSTTSAPPAAATMTEDAAKAAEMAAKETAATAASLGSNGTTAKATTPETVSPAAPAATEAVEPRTAEAARPEGTVNAVEAPKESTSAAANEPVKASETAKTDGAPAASDSTSTESVATETPAKPAAGIADKPQPAEPATATADTAPKVTEEPTSDHVKTEDVTAPATAATSQPEAAATTANTDKQEPAADAAQTQAATGDTAPAVKDAPHTEQAKTESTAEPAAAASNKPEAADATANVEKPSPATAKAEPEKAPDHPTAATASNEDTAPKEAQDATAVFDPTPGSSGPDPLTPPQADNSPIAAPGTPEQSAAPPKAVVQIDPIVTEVRNRLALLPNSGNKAVKAEIEAIKAFYGKDTAYPLWVSKDGLTRQGQKLFAALRRADTFGLDPSAFATSIAPTGTSPIEKRADAEISLSMAALKYARYARGGRIYPPSLSSNIDLKPRLFEPSSLLKALAIAPSADIYLEGLNPHHAGFKALKKALAEVRAEERKGGSARSERHMSQTERRIIVNMERWRWLPDHLGSFYIWDNVPEQVTRVFHNGKKVLQERIVVGKPKTPTPMFSAPMRFVIFQPSWGVPDGIKTNELAPMLRRAQAIQSSWFFSDNDSASRVLRRYELKVSQGGRLINPDSVNWGSVDIRRFDFSQGPSPKNVLGVVKFRFPNRFDVYMHDTPERHLFSRSNRSFSHGCMRVQNTLDLAATILAYDKGWSSAHVKSLAERSGTTNVTLDKRVPVHIVYFTAVVDHDGKLQSFGDIYGMDSRVASALAGRSVTLSSAQPVSDDNPGASSERRSRRAPRARPSSGGSASATPSPSPSFRPFANAASSGG
ncbi:MAG: L,D-transpeptidase family protein [Hyphomicrobiaceae bacterium]